MMQMAPLDEIRALVEERGRYAQWLDALEARRGSAPAHVLDRVRGDYAARLAQTQERLASHAPALRAQSDALGAREAELRQTIGEREDALAEIELRTLVGEYSEAEGAARRDEAQGALGALRDEAGRLGAELGDLRGLLAQASEGQGAAGAAEPGSAPRDGGAADGPGVSAASGAASAVDDTPPAPRHVPSREEAGAAVAAAFAEAVPDVPGFPMHRTGGDPNGAEFAGQDAPGHHFAPPADRSATPPLAGQGFAEEAIGAGASAGGAPLPGAHAGQEKTLRCPDCGAMNYPTEWYCERCGGELAVL